MRSKDCCLAVVKDLQSAGRICLELHLNASADVAVSVFGKPDVQADSTDFLRIKGIGIVVCRGAVARKLKELPMEQPDGAMCFEDVLNSIGVPAHHKDTYEQALRAGLIIMVLQGSGEPLRRLCGILEESSLEKPVLYLT